jgi:alkylated DNA repair protein (DNA oxidative demethylase)
MIHARDTVVEHLEPHVQARLVEEVRGVLRGAPLVRPSTPGGAPMRVQVSAAGELGWVGDGAYRYDPHQRDGRPWPPIPALWTAIASRVAGRHPWDSAIVNWYDSGAALGWHRDLAEGDHTLPIVTISLGDAASWAVCHQRADLGSPCPGVHVESRSVSRVRLESGDVTLLAGESRLYWHTIERIIPAPLFSPLANPGRVSITLRVAGARS